MMEDHFIENNNGLNERIDLDETKDQGSVGTNAFITPLAQYKPHDDHLGLRRRRRTDVSYSEDDHQHQETHIQNEDHFPDDHLGTNASAQYKPHYCPFKEEKLCQLQKQMMTGVETPDLISRFGDNDNLDEVSQMISPPTVIAEARTDCNLNLGTARHTEPSITPSSPLQRTDIQECNSNDEEVHGERKGLSKKPSITPSDPSHRTDIQEDNSNDEEVHGERKSLSKKQRITLFSLLSMNTPHRIDIQEGSSNDDEVHGMRKGWSQKVYNLIMYTMDFEWIFVINNIVLEFMSAIFTQLSSKQKPKYALFNMLLSYYALLTCIIELIYEDHRHQKIPIWRRIWGTWYNDQPQRRKSFATLNNIVALACALGQCVVTTINYKFENPIKVTVSPIILAFGVLFSKTFKYRQREAL